MLADRGNDVYFAKVRDMVSYEIEARLENGDFSEEIEQILMDTRMDLIQALSQTYSSSSGGSNISLHQIITGLETSKDLTVQTVREFARFFKGAIENSIENGEKLMSTGQIQDFCFRVLPFVDESDTSQMKELQSLCQNVQMQFYLDGPSLSWDDFIEKKGVDLRGIFRSSQNIYGFKDEIQQNQKMCSLRNYYRFNLLLEQKRRRRMNRAKGPSPVRSPQLQGHFLQKLIP